MHNLTETGIFGATVPVPDDGVDYRTAASLYAALQELTNRTRTLYEFLGSLGGTVALPAHLSVAGNVNSHGLLTASTTFHCVGAATFDTAATFSSGIGCTTLILSETLNTVGLLSTGTSSLHNCTIDALTVLGEIDCAALSTPALSCSYSATFGNTCVFNGPVTLNSIMTCQGIGRVTRAARIGVTNGATTLDPAVATTWLFGSLANPMTGDINATLTGGDNEEIEVTLQGAAGHVLNVLYPGGGTLFTLTGSFAAGTYNYVRVKRIAGTWYFLNYATHP